MQKIYNLETLKQIGSAACELMAIPMNHFELIAEYNGYHFKTSPEGDEYFIDTSSGALDRLRFYGGEKRR